ncbi:MAG TPA: tetratricopeptide repeat protein [Stellaceae bacterium]|nr:tetratricopeptide repeat protein [Stellaceae bacterium]
MALTFCIGAGLEFWRGSAPAMPEAAAFVGSEVCAGCHHPEASSWRSSHHGRAMAPATGETVLGDFDGARFEKDGVQSRFFRKDRKFLVETDGPDGTLATFEVAYTFGVEPLQQYLIAFPDGRLQALSIAWDSRPKEQGGQRWFHLYPNERIAHDDVLHWTKLGQNWNFMCSECHSTGVRRNYDAATDRFATSFTEVSVGCESCHGQGSRHLAWARERQRWHLFGGGDDPSKGLLVRFDERTDVAWSRDPASGEPRRSAAPAVLRKEVETCGLCHARRDQVSEDWVPGRWLADTHIIAPMSRDLYGADGQMRDIEETYNYGSFKQSRMFAAGVTCGDCHDPHSAALRLPGDGVCMQCHSAEKYDAASHRHHEGADPPLACASCHMPLRTYMVIDRRHDHGFRIPRPDVSVRLGTPNACNDCHRDKSPAWAAAAVESWYGPSREGFQHYADAFHAAWTEAPNAGALLAAVAADASTPAFIRASAMTELGAEGPPANAELARRGLADPDPMVRIAAIDMLEGAPPAQLWPQIAPLLSDPILSVRLRAVSALAPVPAASQPQADRARFERAAAEFVAAQRLNADRPEARSTLGAFYAERGLAAEAEAEYRAALRLNPKFAAAAIDLADLYRQLGREHEAGEALRTALLASPQDASLHHALGLQMVRTKDRGAVEELRRAAELEPQQARYVYVYAVALSSTGRPREAIAVLEASLARHPSDRATLQALVAFNRDIGDAKSALAYAERLAQILPDDRDLAALIESLKKQVESAKP